MLAYTFWHWPSPQAVSYEQRIAAFQAALAAEPPAGFRGGLTLRHEAAPWLPREAYLDWYMVDGFADLHSLNDGAISASRKAPHDSVAALAAGGLGGVYKLHSGPAEPRFARVAHWFHKPAGMRYDQLYEKLTDVPGSLWMRQMVLGPSPEFVLFALGAIALPFPAVRANVFCVYP